MGRLQSVLGRSLDDRRQVTETTVAGTPLTLIQEKTENDYEVKNLCIGGGSARVRGSGLGRVPLELPTPRRLRTLSHDLSTPGSHQIKATRLVGTYSLSFLPVLYGLNHFTGSEVLLAAALSAIAGCVVGPKIRPSLIQVLLNSANLTLSAGSCLLGYAFLADRIPYLPAILCAMVALYFAINTLLVSGILSLVQGKPLSSVCEAWYLWSFVYYLAGAAVMGLAMSPHERSNPGSFYFPLPT